MTKVDIAIPCYNYGRYLRACVESVLNQQVDDLRVLIVDNASTDDSLGVARALAGADSRIEVLARPTNLGAHASFNAGIEWARAAYFMVLCADDLLSPSALASMVSVLDQNPEAAFAYGQDLEWRLGTPFPGFSRAPTAAGWRVREGRDFLHERCRYPERLVSYGMILTRTSFQKTAGHYRPELPHSDDFEMLLRLACLGRVADIDAVVGIRRIHNSNRSREVAGERTGGMIERMDAFDSFFRNEGKSLSDAPQLLRLARASLSGQAYWRGIKDLLRGRVSALELFALALRLNPKAAVIPPFGYLTRLERSLANTIRGLP